MRSAVAFSVSLVLASCASSPTTHYHTLSIAPGAPQSALAMSSPVQIAAVHMPASLDRRAMVIETGPNDVEISDQDRWSAPLGEMARSVLSQDLAAHLPSDMVVMPEAPATPETAQIVVTVARFGPQENKVVLVANWSLLKGDPAKTVLRRDVAMETSRAGKGADGAAAGMSDLLGRLAARMASTLSAMR